ncbi:MAG: arsenic efflux protein [Deltaproteobacteria bacterium]|nr:arsenic efflux protein [Deltaproteobacteria bacterium]MBW1909394.1 arsenic efflux protein [Deltaproteobacteria bacterium]MBW2032753.1 arsenic efflux protein [Deltaproteobacteria bacterium]MBW2168009.1 arsenic efflux protein [Deltaproteobacteria bacterium]
MVMLLGVFKQALMITVFVFVMMLLVDFIDMASKGRMSGIIKGGQWRQYTLASFLGSTPGCLGAFMNVSLYVHGMISFGAIVGGMIATSGDEAFVMLAQFPGTALALFVLLFVFGIVFAWISDRMIQMTGITPCESCFDAVCEECLPGTGIQEKISDIFRPANLIENYKSLSFTRFLLLMLIVSFLVLITTGTLGPLTWDWKRITFISLSLGTLCIITICSEHYLESHIWDHIIKKHLFRVFLWSFGALLFVHWGLAFWNLDAFIHDHMLWVLLIGALIGIIPESGPHLIFVMMYAQGLIPFSVLFTTSFVQDGHGMLPLLSYSLKDSVLIKIFNLVFGLAVGATFFSLGL